MLTSSLGIESVADAIMKAQAANVVSHDGTIDIGDSVSVPSKSRLVMNSIQGGVDTAMVTSFKVLLPADAAASQWVFTSNQSCHYTQRSGCLRTQSEACIINNLSLYH